MFDEPKFIAVDFFCGAGGTTRGLIDAGGYVIAGIDKDNNCEKTFTDNNINEFGDRTKPVFLNRDIFPRTGEYPSGEQDMLIDDVLKLVESARQTFPGVPLLFAICAPCQPFTKLSKKELSEKRKLGRKRDQNLLGEALKFVERFKPEVVLSENVAGIHQPRFGGVWEVFQEGLELLGYATGSNVVCASKFGIAQKRKRSILGAVRTEALPTMGGRVTRLKLPAENPEASTVTVKTVIDHLPKIAAGELHPTVPNHRARTLSPLNIKRIASAKPGVSNKYLESTEHGDLSLDCHQAVNKRLKVRCFTDVYTRMRPDRPSPTITTKCHSISNGRFGHYDTSQNRGISLREAAMLQSFSEEYIFYPTDKVDPIARMIGNAVPPKLAEFFARFLVELLPKQAAGLKS